MYFQEHLENLYKLIKSKCTGKDVIKNCNAAVAIIEETSEDSLLEKFLKTQEVTEPAQLEHFSIEQKLNLFANGKRFHSETKILEFWHKKKKNHPYYMNWLK